MRPRKSTSLSLPQSPELVVLISSLMSCVLTVTEITESFKLLFSVFSSLPFLCPALDVSAMIAVVSVFTLE